MTFLRPQLSFLCNVPQLDIEHVSAHSWPSRPLARDVAIIAAIRECKTLRETPPHFIPSIRMPPEYSPARFNSHIHVLKHRMGAVCVAPINLVSMHCFGDVVHGIPDL
ncbi:hypothetical protein ACQRIT_007634 [Beauveria bassiana]